jgi:hypothetical protein
MEAMRQLDEMRRIEPELPAANVGIAVATPLQAPLKDLQPQELDVLQLVHNFGRLPTILDHSARTDLETAQIVLALMQREYLTTR